jgi:protein MpaA
MNLKIFGKSALGQPIFSYEFSNNGPEVLILGGIHGDEIEGVVAAHALIQSFLESFNYKLNICVVPEANPDGVLLKTRGNGNAVDLNRNLPTKDWSPEIKTLRYHPGPTAGSEPENQALMQYIETKKPVCIISLHSWNPVLNVNGNCRAVAEVISKITGYKIDDEIGYPTPGCLGTWAGIERQSPTLTYEIERGMSIPNILITQVPAILEALKVLQK